MTNSLVALLDFDYDFELDLLEEKLSRPPAEEAAHNTPIHLFPVNSEMLTA